MFTDKNHLNFFLKKYRFWAKRLYILDFFIDDNYSKMNMQRSNANFRSFWRIFNGPSFSIRVRARPLASKFIIIRITQMNLKNSQNLCNRIQIKEFFKQTSQCKNISESVSTKVKAWRAKFPPHIFRISSSFSRAQKLSMKTYAVSSFGSDLKNRVIEIKA